MQYKIEKSKIIKDLQSILGSKNVITSEWNKQSYCKGWRYGEGEALAVIKPRTLIEIWKVLQICVRENIIVIMQDCGKRDPFSYPRSRQDR